MMLEAAPVLTLGDLDHWNYEGTALAVLGQPIKHSISPALHQGALAKMAEGDVRFTAWKYFRFEVAPTDLPKALVLLHAKQFRGLNLTVPHKVLAVDHLAGIDPAASTIGAVNRTAQSVRLRIMSTSGHLDGTALAKVASGSA